MTFFERWIKVEKFINKYVYLDSWEKNLRPFFKQYVIIEDYYNQLVIQMERLIASISAETFWKVFPKLIGIDSRLALLNELVELLKDDNLSLEPEELINWIEKDYKYYTKELCGYNLISETNCSLIFQVF